MSLQTKTIRNFFKQLLAESSPSVMPNFWFPNTDPEKPPLPFGEVTIVNTTRRAPHLRGRTSNVEFGTLQIAIEIERFADGGEDSLLDYFDAIRDLFSAGDVHSVTGGRIVILTDPQPALAYKTDTAYRMPVQVSYQATESVQ